MTNNINFNESSGASHHVIVVMDKNLYCCGSVKDNLCCQVLGLITIGIPYMLLLAAFFIEVIIYEYFTGNKVLGQKHKNGSTEELIRVALFICSVICHVLLLELIT